MTLISRALNKFSVRKTKKKNGRKERQSKQWIRKSLALVCLVLVFTPMTFVPVVSINPGNNIAGTTDNHFSVSIKLDTKSQYALAAPKNSSQIIPGESEADKEAAAAAAQAAAQAQAQAAAKARQASAVRVVSVAKTYNDPANFDDIYARAQAAYGVDARILKAIHTVETGGSGSTSETSSAGAVGPMQFLPSTWAKYGVDGDGDGKADITDVSDAIFTAAHYLSASGYPDVQKALWSYNPSTAYYNKVMNVAHSLGC